MREIKKYRYLMAGALTILIFVLGMLFSNLVDQSRYRSLKNEIQENRIEIESRQLQLSYLKSSEVQSCKALEQGISSVVEGYNNRLNKVQKYQENSFFRKNSFQNIKRKYILSGIRYWMYAQEVRNRCDYGSNTVLFFTKNMFGNSECDKCESVGSELTLLKKKYGDQLLVFTIPTELNDGAVSILESQYNVTETPTIVINGKKKLEGFRTSEEIERYLNISED